MTALFARLIALLDTAVDTFLNAVADWLIAAWIEADQ